MCVTNTKSRRPQTIFFNPIQLALFDKQSGPDLSEPQSIPSVEPTFSATFDPLATYSEGQIDKSKPKRRRKPQKPGKTAKNNDRHFVVHHYHDHSLDVDSGDEIHNQYGDESSSSDEGHHRRRGGVAVAFPIKLHEVLEQVEADGFADILSWQPHGRCFMIHKPKDFVDLVMPRYFRQSKLTSFQRQLNLYGFNRITRGTDSGAYYCEYFLRWRVFLCKHMIRTKVKGTRFKAASNPEHEPDFYSMPFVTPVDLNGSLCSMSTTSASSSDSVIHQQFKDRSLRIEPIPLCYSTQESSVPVNTLQTVSSADVPNSNTEYDFGIFNDDEYDESFDDFSLDLDFEMSLNDDIQLGYMLEKLLE